MMPIKIKEEAVLRHPPFTACQGCISEREHSLGLPNKTRVNISELFTLSQDALSDNFAFTIKVKTG